MTLEIRREDRNKEVHLFLGGRLDTDSCAELQKETTALEGERLALDFANCDYVSSAGLRTLLMLHKRQRESGGSLTLRNAPTHFQTVLDVTGLAELFDWSPKYREISLEGAELISRGAFGDCYRLDRETVVKLYRDGVDQSVAEKEKRLSRAAFKLGAPTAISYDVVKSGNRTGIVYEMLDAELFSAIIRRNPEDVENHARLLSDIAKTIHGTVGDTSVFPDIKRDFHAYIEQMGFFLDAADIALLHDRMARMPDVQTCVHFDIHSSNIMLKDGQPFIIDMGDFSIGSYLFDIGLLATIYATPEFAVCEKATGLSQEHALKLFDSFLKAYFSDMPAEDFVFFNRNRYFLASLRAIYTITVLPSMRDDLARALKELVMPKIRQEY